MDMVERRARKIAADKMGLVKDPLVLSLPEELWGQAVPEAATQLDNEEAQRTYARERAGRL